MKIRIKGDSLRLRLSRGEVDRFGQEGYIEEQTAFANGTFTYALRRREDGDHLAADFDGAKITVYVPAAQAAEWTGTDLVGLRHFEETAPGRQLFLLLEKDFKCLDGEVLEDQSDNYDNPSTACS